MARGHGGKRKGAGRRPGAISIAKREIAEEAKQYATAALQTLVNVMHDDDAPPSSKVSAATAILDRGYGKPHISADVNHGVQEDNPLKEILDYVAAKGKRITDGDD